MTNYCALIVNNMVSDLIVADYEWVTANLAGQWLDLGGDPLTVGIGYTYENGQFIPPMPQPENE
jgi:hypothetical protein